MTLRVGLTHPALTKLTFMDYLLTMLRNRLRRKHSYDNEMIMQSGFRPKERNVYVPCRAFDAAGLFRQLPRCSSASVA